MAVATFHAAKKRWYEIEETERLEEERAEDPRFLDEQYGKDGLV